MYLEWTLPRGGGGHTAQYVAHLLRREIDVWYQQHRIPHRVKIVKYTVRLTFDDDSNYTVFAMSWNPRRQMYTDSLAHWMKFRVIDDLNNRQDSKDQV